MSEANQPKEEASDTGRKKKKDIGFIGILNILAQAVVIAVVIRIFLFQPFNIPSGSLVPTLLIGDYVMVSKYSYGWSKYSVPLISSKLPNGRLWGAQPQRGDIAVFKLPRDNETDYIKRVVGLPGDRIQMKLGRLYINGTIVPREPDGTHKAQDAFGRDVDVPRYVEILPNGVRHPIIEMQGDNGYYDNTDEFLVPEGHFFMMGDNRDNSDDSRDLAAVGYVPYDNFVGKGQFVFLSFENDPSWREIWKWPQALRFGRLFTWVR